MPSLGDSKSRTHLSCFGYDLVKFHVYVVVGCLVTKSCLTLQCNGLYAAHQAPLSMGFPRQEYWSGLSFPSPGDLPNPGIEFSFPALTGIFYTTEPPGKPYCCLVNTILRDNFLGYASHMLHRVINSASQFIC